MMNKKRAIGIFAVVMVLAVLEGCGGSVPKGLAKQSVELGKQALAAIGDAAKTAEIQAQIAEIDVKVDALSVTDRQIYNAEVARLSVQSLGDVMKDAGSALQDAAGSLSGELKNAADTSAGAMGDAAGLSQDAINEAAQKIQESLSSEEIQDAANATTDALKSASNALKSLGN